MEEKTLAQFSSEHYEWIKSVGWAGKRTPLENLGRIGSEIGELCDECRGDELGDGFQDEFADVLLSTFTFLKELPPGEGKLNDEIGINELARIEDHNMMGFQKKLTTMKTPLEMVSYGFRVLGHVMFQYDEEGGAIADFQSVKIIRYFLAVGNRLGIHINEALTEKMAKNQLKGNRGRKK